MPSNVTPNNIKNIPLYTKRYDKFVGVDFSTDPTQVKDYRSPYAQNVISDTAGFPEKRLGWRTRVTVDSPINGLYYCVFTSGTGLFIIHGKKKLYTWDGTAATATLIYSSMADAKSTFFAHDGKLYILDGTHYLVCKETGAGDPIVYTYTVTNVADDTDTFVPTTLIGVPPAGGGTAFEAVNLLNTNRKNSFVGDALSHLYHLDSTSITSVSSVKIEGVEQDVATTAWARGTEDGTCVSFIVPTIASTGDVYLSVSGRSYVAVDAGGTPIAMSTLTPDGRASYLLTDDKNEAETYYLAKPFSYVAAAGETLVNCPTLTATRTENVFTLVSKDYVVSTTNGTVDFAQPPQVYSGGGGVDNVVITFSKTTSGYADKINKCTIHTFYGYNNDNRLFFSGNPDSKNMDWQSGLDDPTYFPDTGYNTIGADTSAIMGYLKQYDSLLIIKSDNEQDAEIFLRTAILDADNNILFPVKQGIKGVGAISKYAFATLRDDPIFLAREGVFGISSTSVQQERVIQDRSFFVNKYLNAESSLNNAVATVWNGYYVLAVNNQCYVADSRQRSATTGTGSKYSESGSAMQYGYEWYYWTNIPAVTLLENSGALYFGTSDGKVCMFNTDITTMSRFSDDGTAITARWSTKMDDFNWLTKRKRSQKRDAG